MNVILTLFSDIEYDSRPRRALSYLSQFSKVILIHRGPSSVQFRAHNIFSAPTAFAFAKQIYKSLVGSDIDFIYAVGLLSLLYSLPAKILTRKFLIYDSREVYLKDKLGHSTYSWKHRLIEAFCMKFVDAIVCANEERLGLMKAHYKNVKFLSFVHNVSNLNNISNFSPKTESPLLKVVYQGHIGVKRGIDKFLKSISLVQKNFEVIFIVPEKDHSKLQDLLIGYKVKFKILNFMPLPELLSFLATCDLGYVAYELYGPNNIFCEPNKLYEYAYSNLKMITSPQIKFKKIFNRHPIGHCFNEEAWSSENYQALAKDIEIALELKPTPDAFFHFREEFNSSNEQARLKEFINSLPI